MSIKKKKLIFNSIMGFAIISIIFGAFVLIGNTRGWFSTEVRMVSDSVVGNATITRNGITYTLQSGVWLRDGDEIETGTGDSVKIIIDGNKVVSLNKKTSVVLKASDTKNKTEIKLVSGEIFCEIDDILTSPDYFKVTSGDRTIEVTGTVFGVSVASDVVTLNVLEGSAELSAGADIQTVKAGEYGTVLSNADGEEEITSTLLAAGSLNEFFIDSAISASANRALCFTAADLQNVLTVREQEASAAQAEAATSLATLLEQGGNVVVSPNSSSDSGSGSSDSSSSGSSTNTTTIYTCTVQIRCDTILNNMGDLTAGKDKYVPSNGVILGTSTLQFYEGETVFDVLKRTCSYAGIQLEYSYTPIYGSYYIEGINNLYEFDCGSQSGWMYKVNGWFPNYGCSSYTLKAGDTIVWCYTCKGLGADVGGGV